VRVFGSVARGDDQENSDVDFLVDVEAGRNVARCDRFRAGRPATPRQECGRTDRQGFEPVPATSNPRRSGFSVKDDSVYLQHIRDALDDIAMYASAVREAFFAERMRQDATIRKLQVIG